MTAPCVLLKIVFHLFFSIAFNLAQGDSFLVFIQTLKQAKLIQFKNKQKNNCFGKLTEARGEILLLEGPSLLKGPSLSFRKYGRNCGV